MTYKIGDNNYPVIINKKRIKNAYIRVNEDMEIVISINHFVPNFEINKLLEMNKNGIERMIDHQLRKKEKSEHFYFLGEEYDVIINDSFFDIDHDNKKIYTKSLNDVDKHIKKYVLKMFEERLNHVFNMMNLDIQYPSLKLRKMKTRWGVCNRRNHSITLNIDLFKYGVREIDYVIIHELSHFKHFDHGKKFWNLVEIYESDYKKIRKKLKQ